MQKIECNLILKLIFLKYKNPIYKYLLNLVYKKICSITKPKNKCRKKKKFLEKGMICKMKPNKKKLFNKIYINLQS